MGDRIYVADKPTLDAVYNILAAEPVYGFIEHCNILAPTERIEYIGLNKDYTPLSVNITTDGSYDLNSWADFPFLKGNKPYMVRSDGTPDYQLDENDYTLREDGTASDVENTDYDGGAFAWLPKIYKAEYMAGDDRYVLFRFTKAEGYEAVGFIDPDGNELEGVWLPMFYGSIIDDRMTCISGTDPTVSNTTATEKTAIDAFGERAKFWGGPIVETLNDLMLMFAKTSSLQGAYGYGNRNGSGVLENAVVDGGQFYGTNDAKSLNKVFHSIVPITYNQYMRDPYLLCVKGRVKVSTNYNYDVSGDTYLDTGIDVEAPEENSWAYPHKYRTVPGYGSFPVAPYNGSSSTGGCDGLYRLTSQATMTAIARRFGCCGNTTNAGPRCLNMSASVSSTSNVNAAVLLLPPPGVTA